PISLYMVIERWNWFHYSFHDLWHSTCHTTLKTTESVCIPVVAVGFVPHNFIVNFTTIFSGRFKSKSYFYSFKGINTHDGTASFASNLRSACTYDPTPAGMPSTYTSTTPPIESPSALA